MPHHTNTDLIQCTAQSHWNVFMIIFAFRQLFCVRRQRRRLRWRHWRRAASFSYSFYSVLFNSTHASYGMRAAKVLRSIDQLYIIILILSRFFFVFAHISGRLHLSSSSSSSSFLSSLHRFFLVSACELKRKHSKRLFCAVFVFLHYRDRPTDRPTKWFVRTVHHIFIAKQIAFVRRFNYAFVCIVYRVL